MRIRFADAIYQYRQGTSLNITILFASLMKLCGLHPVIILQNSHAYIGCHLIDRYFSEIPMDDLQTIRKLTELDESLVIETTMVSSGSTFSAAEAVARAKLNVDGEFQCAIDIIRARYSGIRSLPLKQSINCLEFAPLKQNIGDHSEESKRYLQKEIDLSKFENIESSSSRMTRQTKKLLDLSLRNPQLNIRDTKQVIPIACTDIASLKDKIAANETFSLNFLLNLLGKKDMHDLAILRNSEAKNDIKILLNKDLSQRLLSPLVLRYFNAEINP